nr:hypothetical protein [Paenibacillus aquistagni]
MEALFSIVAAAIRAQHIYLLLDFRECVVVRQDENTITCAQLGITLRDNFQTAALHRNKQRLARPFQITNILIFGLAANYDRDLD